MKNTDMLSTRNKFCKAIPLALCLFAVVHAAPELPPGVTLAPGVELPDDFKMPAGVLEKLPAGFEISAEMIEQYLKYLE